MRTRIIATLGPACADTRTMARMVEEGVSVFRFNFSHGTFADHERMLGRVRKVQQKIHRRVQILQDLEGHRIRTGRLTGGLSVVLKAGQRFVLYRQHRPGGAEGVALDYRGPFHLIPKDEMIYIDDGKIHLQVLRTTEQMVVTRVVQEGVLGEHKGVNIPGAPLDFPSISEKDASDLAFAIRHRIEYVAQSFVRDAQDVLPAHEDHELGNHVLSEGSDDHRPQRSERETDYARDDALLQHDSVEEAVGEPFGLEDAILP